VAVTEFISVHLDPDRPGIATLALSRPPTNALTRQVYREIGAAAAELAARDDVAAVIFYGGHEIFSAGLTLALAADWRISGDNVKLGATEILAGLIPDAGGIARLTRAVGVSRAKELVYSGRFFDAEEALALGVIDEMVAPDDVYGAAAAWAGRFVDGPRQALAAAKAGVDEVFDLTAAERLAADRSRYTQVFTAALTNRD
jgi:enoyl-CoA hydratase